MLRQFLIISAVSSFAILPVGRQVLHSPFLPVAHAATLSDPNYSLDVDTVDTNPQPTPKTPKEVLGSVTQSLKSPFTTGPNYTVNTSSAGLGFSLTQDEIDLGILSATNPVIRTSQIGLADQGQVLIYENHPLQAQDKTPIFDTTCDNGSCTELTAATWMSALTYGFGYRCDGGDGTCDSQFKTSNTYKQYPDSSRDDLPEPVATNLQPNKATSSMVTYKVTISSTQKQEGYYNTITYLAIPNF